MAFRASFERWRAAEGLPACQADALRTARIQAILGLFSYPIEGERPPGSLPEFYAP
jgi:hypothetical protein